jgi:L-alanine-DL-glutamate epimerase-like enolase superfamily enzyme
MKTRVKAITVHTRRPFAIARSSDEAFERVILEIEEDGFTGRGEAAPTRYYGQDAEGVAESLRGVEIRDAWNIEEALTENDELPPTALAALDGALHDLAAKRLGIPVYRLLGLARPVPVSAYTLGIADLETTVAEAKRPSSYPILKIKLGSREDLETVRAVAGFSEAEIWVDGNEAFTPEEAPEIAAELRETGVAMIEQPVPASAGPEALKNVAEAVSPLPVVADESSIVAADVPRLAGSVSGVNVKLAKCGGIRRALEMVHTARAHGMLAMLGCMVETSLGIAAAAHISGLFDFVDLDGAMLLADDPFVGIGYENGRILLLDAPGLGVRPEEPR